MSDEPLLLSPRQAARLLGVSDSTVRRMVRAGQLRAQRHGRNFKIARGEIERHVGRPVGDERSELYRALLELQAQQAALIARLVRLEE